MTETGAQSGVRSLLAKFETSNQNNTTSPPSRGRSPAGSDTPGSTRPLSKVRASFVAVERAAQSSPASSLRKESGRSDSPAVRSVSSEDVDTGLKSPIALPRSNGLETALKTDNDNPAEETTHAGPEQKDSERRVENATSSEDTSTKEPDPLTNRPTAAAPAEQPQKQSPAPKTVTKRPSNVHLTKGRTPTTASKPPSTASPKSATNPRTTSSTKPASERTSKPTARQTSTTAARSSAGESTKAVTHRPSRTTLNTATRTISRPSPGAAKSTTSPAASNRKPARLPSSATAPSLSSATKSGTASRQNGTGITSNLNRKPSSLQSATNRNQRATTPISNVRKKPSRASLPSQTSNERPGSRASNVSSKPVDEGFLARMMRPTASSASKVHDKVEMKSPPRSSKSARVPSKTTPKKEKDAAEKVGTEKPQSGSKDQTEPKEDAKDHPVENTKRDMLDPLAESPKSEEPAVESVDKASAEESKETPTEAVIQVQPEVPIEAPSGPFEKMPQETSETLQSERSAPQPADVTGPTTETPTGAARAPEEDIPTISEPTTTEPASETVATETAGPSDIPDDSASAGLKEPANAEPSADSSVETSFVDTMETVTPAESKAVDADVDAGHQAQEEKPAN